MGKATLRIACMLLSLFALVGVRSGASAQEFYKDKTIRVIVGFSAGGGFDTYARMIARHMGKHIPGNPTMIVENMGGAGSLLAANYLFARAKPDGLTIGNFIGTLVLQQIYGTKGIEFDARRFEWLGAPVQDMTACALTKASGVTNLEQWFAAKEPVKLGGEAPGANDSDTPRVLKTALGLPIQLIEGYKGTSQIRLAAEAGEVAGGCWTLESIKVTWRKGLESGLVNMVLQLGPKKHPEFPNVPNAIDYAKTDDARMLIETAVHHPGASLRVAAGYAKRQDGDPSQGVHDHPR
jgi:tripartite-type tricarboxylate transporter receptor subunit TctC